MEKVCAVEDSAASCSDFLVAQSGNLVTEFPVAASGIDNMGVRIAECRHHNSAFSINEFDSVILLLCGAEDGLKNRATPLAAGVASDKQRVQWTFAASSHGVGGVVANLTEGTASARINVTDNSDLGLPRAVVRMACSKGTYVRAFARDLGEALGSGAHLDSLQRSRSGEFRIENALTVEEAVAALSRP